MPKPARRQIAKPVRLSKALGTMSQLPPPGPNRLFAEARLPPSAVVDRARVTVNLAESPLGWLVRRGMVTARQFEAGEKLRGDFMRASLAPRTTMSWDAGVSSRGARGAPDMLDASSAQIAAKARFEAAVTAVETATAGDDARRVPTRELPDWLLRVLALFDKSVGQVVPELGKRKNATSAKAQRELGWTPRSAEDAVVATAESLRRLGLLKHATKADR